MENLDLIIFTIILVTLFIIFGIATFLELTKISSEPYDPNRDKGGVVSLKNFIGKMLIGSEKK